MEKVSKADSQTQNMQIANSSKRKIIIALEVLIVLVIVFALVRTLSGPSNSAQPYTPNSAIATNSNSTAGSMQSNPGSTKPSVVADIPQSLGGSKLIDALTGDKAIEDMSMLHGKGIGITGGWVGRYQAKGIVWVGDVADESGAVQLLEAMVRRIGAGNPIFTNMQRKDVEGVAGYTVVGQGQTHFFYQKGNKVVWIALPVAKPDDFLRDAVKSIN